MNVNRMTRKQINRIIANNWLGEHDKQGKQVDYHDYKDQMMQRLWDLEQRAFDSKINEQLVPHAPTQENVVIEPIDPLDNEFMNELSHDSMNECILRAFNKWRVIGWQAQQQTI